MDAEAFRILYGAFGRQPAAQSFHGGFMLTRREITLVVLPAVLLIGSLLGFTCLRDNIALSDPRPLITTPPQP